MPQKLNDLHLSSTLSKQLLQVFLLATSSISLWWARDVGFKRVCVAPVHTESCEVPLSKTQDLVNILIVTSSYNNVKLVKIEATMDQLSISWNSETQVVFSSSTRPSQL